MDFLSGDPSDADPIQDLLASDDELRTSFESLNRLVDSYSALQSFMKLADQGTNVSLEAAAGPLLEAVFAGTGANLSAELYTVEGVRSATAGVIKAILSSIRKFFAALIDFLANADIAATWLQRRVKMLERQVGTTGSMNATSNKITMGRDYRFLRGSGGLNDDAGLLETNLAYLHKVAKVIVKEHQVAIVAAGGRLASSVHGKTGDALTEVLVGIVESIPFDQLASKIGMHAASKERFNRSNVMASPTLLGGMSLFYMQSDLRSKGTNAFKFHGFTFEPTRRNEAKIAPTAELSTLLPNQIGKIPEELTKILTEISNGSNASVRGQVSKTRASLEAFVHSVSEDTPDAENIRKTVSSITHWLQQPNRALILHCMSVVRSTINYCNASIKTYR